MWKEITSEEFTSQPEYKLVAKGVLFGGGIFYEYGRPNCPLKRIEHKDGENRFFVYEITH